MKKRLFLGLSVTALMVLAACNFGGNNSSDAGDNSLPDSSQNEAGSSNSDVSSFSGASSVVSSANSSNDSKPSSSTSSSQADPDWLAREKDIFKNYFYGVTIPFPNLKGLKVLSYDEEDGVAFTYGGTSTPEFLASYAALYDNSWEDDSTAGTEGVTSYYYSKTKKVTTAEGDRYVEVLFCGVNLDTGYFTSDGTGSFYIQISDPYKYSWPKADVDAALELFGATDTVPAYAADRYVVNDRYLTTNNLLAVFAFTTDAEAQTKYGAQLVAAGYTLKGTSNDDFDIYYSVNEQVEVDVHYEEDEQVLDIYIGKITNSGGGSGSSVTSWPADLVSSFLSDVLETEETLPAYTAGTSYEIHDAYYDEGVLWMYIDSTEAAFNAYETALENAGYEYKTTDEYGDDIYLSPLGEIEVDVGFDETSNEVDLWIMAGDDIGGGEEETSAEWPAASVNSVTSSIFGATDTVPAFVCATEYELVTTYLNSYGVLEVYCYTENANAQSAYGDVLLAAGYTYLGKDNYNYDMYASPNGELEVDCKYSSAYGYLIVDIMEYSGSTGGETGGESGYTQTDYPNSNLYVTNMWPDPLIEEYFAQWGVDSNQVPALEGCEQYYFSYKYAANGQLTIQAFTSDATSEATYTASLLAAGFTVGNVISGMQFYVSASGNYQVACTYNASYECLVIYILYIAPSYNAWPVDDVNTCLGIIGTSNAVPAFEGADEYELLDDYAEYGILGVACYTSDANCFADYCAALVSAGYTFDAVDGDGYSCYNSPDGSFQVQVYYDTTYNALIIYVWNGLYL